jgi:hypothetical protein
MKSILDYGAKPDDGIDDTAAIQKALDDGRRDANGNPLFSVPDQYNGLPKALYLPAGTYDVSDTIDWVGCNVTLQGQGSGKTVIRLKDNAAGFSNPAAPKAVIQTQDGNMLSARTSGTSALTLEITILLPSASTTFPTT